MIQRYNAFIYKDDPIMCLDRNGEYVKYSVAKGIIEEALDTLIEAVRESGKVYPERPAWAVKSVYIIEKATGKKWEKLV